MIIFFSGSSLPGIPETAVESISMMNGPLTMFSIGMALGALNRGHLAFIKRVWLVIGLRLIVFPVVIVLLIGAMHLLWHSPMSEKVLLTTALASGAPVAAVITQFAELFDMEPQKAGVCNIVSVLLCVITLPLVAYLYQIVCTATQII